MSETKKMNEKGECKVCAGEMPLNHRRFGAPGCNGCAAFFQRSIEIEAEFVCPNLNQCLIVPSKIGKHCQKCRFAKCLDIGMMSREYIKAHNGENNVVAAQIQQQEPQQPQNTIPEEINNNDAEITVTDEMVKDVQIVDTMLATSLQLPAYLENYLENGNPEIINISMEFLKNVHKSPPTFRVLLLSAFLAKNPILPTEFPLFIHLCFCKMDFPGFEASQKSKMKSLQNDAFIRLPISSVNGVRFLDLVILSTHFLNIFYANL